MIPIGAIVAVLACLVVLAFLWPTITSEPRDDAMADERIAQLDAELDRIHSTLDGLDEQLNAIDRSR